MRLVVAMAIAFLTAQPVYGLECLAGVPLKVQMDQAEVVLLGRVMTAEYVPYSPNSPSRDGFYSLVGVAVEQLWKGTTPKQIHIHQPMVGGGVNFNAAVGDRFVIYAVRLTPERRVREHFPDSAVGFTALQCWTKPVAQVDLSTLGTSHPPQ